MQDLKLRAWPSHSGEWDEVKKMPKETDWKNINIIISIKIK